MIYVCGFKHKWCKDAEHLGIVAGARQDIVIEQGIAYFESGTVAHQSE
jgi:hypothetical protein